MRTTDIRLLPAAAILCTGCATSAPTSLRSVPRVINARAAANPYSVLSSIVSFDATPGDSARVVSVAPGDSSASPYAFVATNPTQIATLGLLANTAYKQIVEVKNAQGGTAVDTTAFTTGALPSYVQRATLLQTRGTFSGGYTLVSPTGYTVDTALAVAFDLLDRVRWYRMFPGHTSFEIKQQPNSHFTLYLNRIVGQGTTTINSTSANGLFVEFLPSGDSLRFYRAPNDLPTDTHEMWLSGSSSPATAHLFALQKHTTDLAPINGPASGPIDAHWLHRLNPDGAPEFGWNSWTHYTIIDCLLGYRATGGDFDHPNAIEFDLDSNYIVSFRNLSAIVKLDYNTGATMWQLGGRNNQFRILNDPQALPFGPTSGQHSVRVLPNGHLLIYDNGNLLPAPRHSRAVEYALDTVAKTAAMVWEYLPNPPIYTFAVGSVQRLENGNTLVGFGLAGQIHEVDANARLVASALFTLNGVSQFYRANRIRSLYTYYPLNGR